MNINITEELPDCVTLHAPNGENRTYFERFDRARHMVLVEPEQWFRIEQEMTSLRAENDGLRELVRISIEHCNSGTCDECLIQGEDGSCPYADMARELGIEVSA